MAHQYPPNYSSGGQDAYYAYGRDEHEFPPPQGYPGNGGGGFYPPDAGNAYPPPPPPPQSGRTVPPLYIPPPSRTPSPGYPQPPYPPHPPHSSSSSHPPSPHQHHPYGPPSPHQQHPHGPPSPSPHQQHPYGPPSPSRSPRQQYPYGPPSPSAHQQHPYGPPSPHQQHSYQQHQHQHQHSHSSHTTPKLTNGPEPGLPTMNPSSSSSSTPGPEPGLPTMNPGKLSSRPAHRPASFGMTAPSYVNKHKDRLSSGRRRKDDGCNDCFSVCGCFRCTCTFCILLLALLFLVVGIALFGYSKTLPSRCPDLCNIGGGGRFTNSTSDNLNSDINGTSDNLNRDINGTSNIANGDINKSNDVGASSSDDGGQTLQRRFDDGILYERDDVSDHYDAVTLERRQVPGGGGDNNNNEENPVSGKINDAENKCNGLCSSAVYNALRYTGIGLLCVGGFMLACTLLTLFCRAAKSGGRGSGCLFCC